MVVSSRVEVFKWENAPAYSRQISSFNRDERCHGVYSVVGKHESDVYDETFRLYDLLRADNPKVVDYDLALDNETGNWCGTVVEDI